MRYTSFQQLEKGEVYSPFWLFIKVKCPHEIAIDMSFPLTK